MLLRTPFMGQGSKSNTFIRSCVHQMSDNSVLFNTLSIIRARKEGRANQRGDIWFTVAKQHVCLLRHNTFNDGTRLVWGKWEFPLFFLLCSLQSNYTYQPLYVRHWNHEKILSEYKTKSGPLPVLCLSLIIKIYLLFQLMQNIFSNYVLYLNWSSAAVCYMITEL